MDLIGGPWPKDMKGPGTPNTQNRSTEERKHATLEIENGRKSDTQIRTTGKTRQAKKSRRGKGKEAGGRKKSMPWSALLGVWALVDASTARSVETSASIWGLRAAFLFHSELVLKPSWGHLGAIPGASFAIWGQY